MTVVNLGGKSGGRLMGLGALFWWNVGTSQRAIRTTVADAQIFDFPRIYVLAQGVIQSSFTRPLYRVMTPVSLVGIDLFDPTIGGKL
jgi:hypothetical protein